MNKKCINIEKMNEKIDNFIKTLNNNESNTNFYFYPLENEIQNLKTKIKKYWIFS